MAKLRLFVPLVVLVSAFAVLLFSGPGGRAVPVAAQGLGISLDADITNGGPCATIDAEVTVEPGQAFQVAACVSGLPQGLTAVQFDVVYDDTIISAPEVALAPAALDDNPDANAGTTTWGDSLGEGWSCDILDIGQQPVGDGDPATGPNAGVAQIACWTVTGTMTLGDNEDSGVLAVLSFVAGPGSGGSTPLILTRGILVNSIAEEIGSCNPGGQLPMSCANASVSVVGTAIPPEQVPSPTAASGQIERVAPVSGAELIADIENPSAVETPASGDGTAEAPAATAGAGAEETPEGGNGSGTTGEGTTGAEESEEESQEDDGGNDWLLPTAIIVVAAVAVAGGASLYYLRRRRT